MADPFEEVVGVDLVASELHGARQHAPPAALACALHDEKRPPGLAILGREREERRVNGSGCPGRHAGARVRGVPRLFPGALERLRAIGKQWQRQKAVEQVGKERAGERRAERVAAGETQKIVG